MSGTPVFHHDALGIHPGAYVQASPPITTGVQDHILWVDTGTGPPYQLKVWDGTAGVWRAVGISVTGVGAGGTLYGACLTFPNGAQLCNPSTGLVTLDTPGGQFDFDDTGLTLPGGHRLEVVPG